MTPPTSPWRVRTEDGVGEGRPIGLDRLRQAVADGVLSEADQVREPGRAEWVLVGDHPALEEYLPARPLLKPDTGEDAQIEMTPMIDVTFQLIIFFMITATFVVQKTLDMPQAEATEDLERRLPTMSELAENNIIVVLKTDGTITVDQEPTTLDDVADALAEAAERRENVELVLDVEDEVAHDMVVRVIDAAAGAEIERIHFVRRAPPAEDARAAGGEPTRP